MSSTPLARMARIIDKLENESREKDELIKNLGDSLGSVGVLLESIRDSCNPGPMPHTGDSADYVISRLNEYRNSIKDINDSINDYYENNTSRNQHDRRGVDK